MATHTVTAEDFARKAQEIFDSHRAVVYKNGASGPSECDCKGYVLWVLRTLGMNVSSAGTNTMIRTQMRSWHTIKDKSHLEKGMCVFKRRDPDGRMKAKFRPGGSAWNASVGDVDVYHVGIVASVKPLKILHCSTGKNGALIMDTAIGKWSLCGWVKWVDPSDAVKPTESRLLQVTAPTGQTVNLRKKTSTKAALVERVPVGSVVQVVEQANGWTKVTYKRWSGWMNNSFLKEVS